MRGILTSRTAIQIGEAIQKIMQFEISGQVETVPLTKANNRFLAEDLIANEDVPAFNRSLYDGYAIKAEETINASRENPILFKVVGKIGAGSVYTKELQPFEAVRIMTGAQMPVGSDACVMLEDVSIHDQNQKQYISVIHPLQRYEKVFLKGHEIKQGVCLVQRGTQITPGVVGLLATFGVSEVLVSKKVKVGILATGSELLEVHEALVPGKIRNSNSYMLASQVENAGGEPILLGKLQDDIEGSLKVIQNAIDQVDILITTGGVSVGDYDYLPDIYERLGATVLFNKIAMRPGSVTTVARLNDQFLFGLSGNPSASFIGFELFVRPVIRTMLANEEIHHTATKAILTEDYPTPNSFTQLIRTKATQDGTILTISSNGLNMSSSITSLVGADALLILPPTLTGYKKGEEVDVVVLSSIGQNNSIFIERGI